MACHVREAKKSVLPGELHRFLHDSQSRFLPPPIDFQPDCRSLASLSEVYIPNYRISKQAGGFKSVRLNPTRWSDCPAPGESIRSPGFSCDHWLLNWCCSFSTMIPGTAPRRHTSPPHSDASSQLITTTVDGDKYASLFVSGIQGDVKLKVTPVFVLSYFKGVGVFCLYTWQKEAKLKLWIPFNY